MRKGKAKGKGKVQKVVTIVKAQGKPDIVSVTMQPKPKQKQPSAVDELKKAIAESRPRDSSKSRKKLLPGSGVRITPKRAPLIRY